MLKPLFACSMIISLLGAFDYHLHPQKVAENTYCFFGKLETISRQNAGNMVNTCYVRTKEGFVVIDSGPTYDYAAQAYAQMQKIEKLPVKYVIVTHDHDDHWQGNSFYKEKGALLIGPRTYQQNVVPGMHTRMERILGNTLYGKTKIVSLDTIVDNQLNVKVGNEIFEIEQPVPIAHTRGDLVVYVPHKKVLFTGDLVFNGRVTSLRDGSIIGSIKALELIDSYHARVIVSGHGYNTDVNATVVFRAYLSTMKKQILHALDNDVPIEEITKTVKMTEYRHLKLYDILHHRNVFNAYRELEMYDDEAE